MGDIFLGRNVSFRTFQPRPEELDDHFAENGRRGFNFTVVGKTPAELEHRMRQGQRRLACATLENIGRSMDEEGVAYSALMPVYPYTGFEEYLAASGLDTRMIPFSSPDFSLPADRMVEKLKRDIARGARGLKIHSVLQNVKMNDPRTRAAVEVFGRAGLPVMFHIGVSYYYLPEQDAAYPSLPEAGAIEDFFELARAFPDYPLIAAHCANKYAVELAEGWTTSILTPRCVRPSACWKAWSGLVRTRCCSARTILSVPCMMRCARWTGPFRRKVRARTDCCTATRPGC